MYVLAQLLFLNSGFLTRPNYKLPLNFRNAPCLRFHERQKVESERREQDGLFVMRDAVQMKETAELQLRELLTLGMEEKQ